MDEEIDWFLGHKTFVFTIFSPFEDSKGPNRHSLSFGATHTMHTTQGEEVGTAAGGDETAPFRLG